MNKFHTKDTKREATRRRKLAWRERNRERNNVYCRTYYQSHLEGCRLTARLSAAKRRGAGSIPRAVGAAVVEAHKIDGRLHCYLCHCDCHKLWEFEHVIPIKDGGTNSAENLRVACRPCNRRKSSKSLEQFLSDRAQ